MDLALQAGWQILLDAQLFHYSGIRHWEAMEGIRHKEMPLTQ